MASSKLTDYELKRLENIRRNGEMMASLKVHSIAADLSLSSKRTRDEAKSKNSTQKKKPKPDSTPVVIRRSLRTRGLSPDVDGLDFDPTESGNVIKVSKSPTPSPRKLGPLSMREAYRGDESDRSLIERIVRIAKESVENRFAGRFRTCKAKILSGSVKKEEGNEAVGEDLGETEVCKAEDSGLSVNNEEREVKADKLSGVLKKEEESEVVNEESGEAKAQNLENLSFSVKKEGKNEVVSEESSEAKAENSETSSFLVKKEEENEVESEQSSEAKAENSGFSVKKEERDVEDSQFDVYSLSLNPKNIVRVLSDRIMSLRFFPCASSRMIVAGNKLGDVGFWNLDHEKDEEEGKKGVHTYLYHTHSGPVSGISIHPHSLSKVFTSCYNGFIRRMDAEKEVFDLIYSSEDSIFSLAQRSTDSKCLYFGEGFGGLTIWDERSGKCSSQRILHAGRINSVDFNVHNPNLMATGSTDGNACIWDLRSIDANKPKSLMRIDHSRSIHSAYFSPSGKCLATTSFDDTVGVHGGPNFEESSRIQHYNQTGRWISPFKAIWGWTDSHLFIGNMKRGVDVISPAQKKTIFTLQSPNLTAIPCRFDVHPYHVGTLAGATGGGQVYVWTSSS